MSFDPLIQALKDNPALAEELRNAKTPRERHAILDAHGIEKPSLDSQFPEAGGKAWRVFRFDPCLFSPTPGLHHDK